MRYFVKTDGSGSYVACGKSETASYPGMEETTEEEYQTAKEAIQQ